MVGRVRLRESRGVHDLHDAQAARPERFHDRQTRRIGEAAKQLRFRQKASRAPSQTFVDRFARTYTPAVVATAIAIAVIPPLTGVGGWSDWFYRALVLLVVACPCALVISTPVTIVSALAAAAREGILIKGGLHLENAGRATVVALDKTGTLTEGEPTVVDIIPFNGMNPGDLLALAAGVEARTEHPIGRAIVRRAKADGVAPRVADETAAITGQGFRARIGERAVYIGNERLFRQLGVPLGAARDVLQTQQSQGRTAVLVAMARTGGETGALTLVGFIAVADRIRPRAREAVRALHGSGIERVVMLTGDNEGTARAVATALGGPGAGIDQLRAELLPDDKVAAVRELRGTNGKVLMVGDGVNDAPALAAAEVGVAMGAAGTDVALETADIALMADDLTKLSTTIRLARKAEGIIRANIAFSLLTKAAFVVLAVFGVATLWMAMLADMGASLLVIVNGLRALRV